MQALQVRTLGATVSIKLICNLRCVKTVINYGILLQYQSVRLFPSQTAQPLSRRQKAVSRQALLRRELAVNT